jgi:hypothetical protein
MQKPLQASLCTSLLRGDSLSERMERYENSAASNEAVYWDFTARTDQVSFLKEHRDWVEENHWGFGDRAFHYMWLLITHHLCSNASDGPPTVLEIGVYKGQVLSLLALCAMQLGASLELYAISPFKGTQAQSRILHGLRCRLQASYRNSLLLGNLYVPGDYLKACNLVFDKFSLDFKVVHVLRGLSTDTKIYKRVEGQRFSAIYIDGDHSFEVARHDILTYGPLIKKGGLLIMDDASCNLPGEGYCKGHAAVSNASAIVPSLGFTNILNIGHNRVYCRI